MDILKVLSDIGVIVVTAVVGALVVAGLAVFVRVLIRVVDLLLLDRRQLNRLASQAEALTKPEDGLLHMGVVAADWIWPNRLELRLTLANRSTFDLVIRHIVSDLSLGVGNDLYHTMATELSPARNSLPAQGNWRSQAALDLTPGLLQLVRNEIEAGKKPVDRPRADGIRLGKARFMITLDVRPGRFQPSRQIQVVLSGRPWRVSRFTQESRPTAAVLGRHHPGPRA